MPVTHFLVTDATAEEVTQRTGLDAHQTALGALVKKPTDPVVEAISMGLQLEAIDRALNPRPPRCCYGTVIHAPNCPSWFVCT